MARLTIAESVAEELVHIGKAKGLQGGIGRHIDDIDSPVDIDKKPAPGLAEKAAVRARWALEVSWAETESHESAGSHRNALWQEYVTRHDRRPSFWDERQRAWIPDSKKVEKVKGPVGDLSWSGWMPMVKATKGGIPREPGVYRIRAMPPGA